jgi:hypothetical protein
MNNGLLGLATRSEKTVLGIEHRLKLKDGTNSKEYGNQDKILKAVHYDE